MKYYVNGVRLVREPYNKGPYVSDFNGFKYVSPQNIHCTVCKEHIWPPGHTFPALKGVEKIDENHAIWWYPISGRKYLVFCDTSCRALFDLNPLAYE